jgi:cytochrome c-type biogenesis protein CcmH
VSEILYTEQAIEGAQSPREHNGRGQHLLAKVRFDPAWKIGKISRQNLVLALALVLLLFVSLPFHASAQERTPSDDEVNAIAKQLYCPVCENVPLDVCPTQACEQWRATIREKLALGWSEDQIKTFFVDQYGDRVLATPPARGLNWIVYVLPPLAIVIGLGVLTMVVRKWQLEAEVSESAIQKDKPELSPDDPYLARLEQELKRRT